MANDEGNIYQLSPLSCEMNRSQLEDSTISSIVPDSPVLSSSLRKTSSNSSTFSFSSHRNAGNAGSTPRKTSKVKNSLEISRVKFKYGTPMECKNSTGNSSIQNSKGSSNTFDDVVTHVTFSSSEEILDPFPMSLSKTIPISQLDLTQERNTSSFSEMTGDDSDVDMFEELGEVSSQHSEPSPFKFLANHSCEYFGDKSEFIPQTGFEGSDHLKRELFEISRQEIEEKINGIIEFLEDSK